MNETTVTIAQSIVSNEKDLANHNVNIQRFEAILADPELEEGELKEKIVRELAVLNSRIKEIALNIKHGKTQISEEDLEAYKATLA